MADCIKCCCEMCRCCGEFCADVCKDANTSNFSATNYEETNSFCKGLIITIFIILVIFLIVSLLLHSKLRFFVISPTIIWFTIMIIYFVVHNENNKEKIKLMELEQKQQQEKYQIDDQNYQCNPPLTQMQNQMVANPASQVVIYQVQAFNQKY